MVKAAHLNWFAGVRAARLAGAALAFALTVALATAFTLGLLADVNEEDDWTVQSFHADYKLSDSTSSSRMIVTETIVMQDGWVDSEFHRLLPTSYLGRQNTVRVLSVSTDGESQRVIATDLGGAIDITVNGPTGDEDFHTYVIQYEYDGVVRNYEGHQAIYWNVNGESWSAPIEAVSATLTVPKSVAGDLTGDSACYQGRYGSSDRCAMTMRADSNGNVVFNTGQISAERGETQTFIVGFAADTFPITPIAESARPANCINSCGRDTRANSRCPPANRRYATSSCHRPTTATRPLGA